jgi:large subunit ribosomal protein L15
MSAILSHLTPPIGATKVARRLGRGPGCGVGKTAGRGQKGQKARSTGNIGKKHFQGGQTPIQRRLPKRGFRNPFAANVVIVNVLELEVFEPNVQVDEELLRAKRLVQGRDVLITVLGNGSLTKPLTVSAHRFSASAVAKIEAAGGKAVVIAAPETPAQGG